MPVADWHQLFRGATRSVRRLEMPASTVSRLAPPAVEAPLTTCTGCRRGRPERRRWDQGGGRSGSTPAAGTHHAAGIDRREVPAFLCSFSPLRRGRRLRHGSLVPRCPPLGGRNGESSLGLDRIFTRVAYVGSVLMALLGVWLLIDGAVEGGILLLVVAAITLVMCLAATAIHRSREK